MIDVVVLLKIKNQKLFTEYESTVLSVMRAHGGELITAFTPAQDMGADTDFDEVHHLRFPSIEVMNAYRDDPEVEKLAELRDMAIEDTRVYISESHETYAPN